MLRFLQYHAHGQVWLALLLWVIPSLSDFHISNYFTLNLCFILSSIVSSCVETDSKKSWRATPSRRKSSLHTVTCPTSPNTSVKLRPLITNYKLLLKRWVWHKQYNHFLLSYCSTNGQNQCRTLKTINNWFLRTKKCPGWRLVFNLSNLRADLLLIFYFII